MMSLEQQLINLLVSVHQPLLLMWQMQAPIHEHSVRICDCQLELFAAHASEPQQGA